MEELKHCPFCGKPLYIKVKQHLKPLLAPLTRAGSLRDELIDITGENYVPVEAKYCPVCGRPLGRRAAPENKPLTLEQLRRMDGETCYQMFSEDRFKAGYAIVDCHMGYPMVVTKYGKLNAAYIFDQGYKIYARKPEGSEKA